MIAYNYCHQLKNMFETSVSITIMLFYKNKHQNHKEEHPFSHILDFICDL